MPSFNFLQAGMTLFNKIQTIINEL